MTRDKDLEDRCTSSGRCQGGPSGPGGRRPRGRVASPQGEPTGQSGGGGERAGQLTQDTGEEAEGRPGVEAREGLHTAPGLTPVKSKRSEVQGQRAGF